MALVMPGRMWQAEKNDMLCKNVLSLAESANEMYGEDDFTANLELISVSSAASNGTVVLFADRNGNVIACSEGHDITNPDSLYNKKVSIDIMNDAYNGVYTEVGTLDGIFDSNYYSAATAIVNRNGEIIGAVFTSYTAENYRIYIVEMLEIFAISSQRALASFSSCSTKSQSSMPSLSASSAVLSAEELSAPSSAELVSDEALSVEEVSSLSL